MLLRFLEFDWSEDPDAVLSASALASPAPARTPELIDEVLALLQALQTTLGTPGPLDEGHRWDLDLHVEQPDGQALVWPQLIAHPPSSRISLSLHLAGDETLRQQLDTLSPP